jgi:hypothetical protein
MSDGAASPGPMTLAGAVGAGLGRVVRVFLRRGSGHAASSIAAGEAPRRSTAEAIGAGAGRTVRQGRGVTRGLFAGAGAFLSRLRYVLGVLFLEVVGLIYLVFGLGIAGLAFAEYRACRTGEHRPVRFEIAVALAALFFYFGVTSFWRSRRKARQ